MATKTMSCTLVWEVEAAAPSATPSAASTEHTSSPGSSDWAQLETLIHQIGASIDSEAQFHVSGTLTVNYKRVTQDIKIKD